MSEREVFEDAVEGIPYDRKSMFGGYGFFVGGNIFAAIVGEGQIGLKLPVKEAFDGLLAIPGAEPMRIDGMPKPMAHWVTVPPAFFDEPRELREWALKAHQMARLGIGAKKKPAKKAAGPSAAKKASKTPGKKAAAKRRR